MMKVKMTEKELCAWIDREMAKGRSLAELFAEAMQTKSEGRDLPGMINLKNVKN